MQARNWHNKLQFNCLWELTVEWTVWITHEQNRHLVSFILLSNFICFVLLRFIYFFLSFLLLVLLVLFPSLFLTLAVVLLLFITDRYGGRPPTEWHQRMYCIYNISTVYCCCCCCCCCCRCYCCYCCCCCCLSLLVIVDDCQRLKSNGSFDSNQWTAPCCHGVQQQCCHLFDATAQQLLFS